MKNVELVEKETSGPLPTTFYDILLEDRAVGIVQLRHKPSKSDLLPTNFDNHIYYEIEPEYRGRGYGTQALILALEEARRFGLTEVILVCREDNVASRRIIESNGGELLDRKQNSAGIAYRKYRVRL